MKMNVSSIMGSNRIISFFLVHPADNLKRILREGTQVEDNMKDC